MRTSNDRRVFEKNPDYFMKALPYLDGVVIEITPDASARLSLLRAGKVEFGHMWAWAAVEEGRSLQKTNPEMRLALTPVIGQAMIEVSTNRSHAADADLNKLLIAQGRELDPKRRRELVDDIQRTARIASEMRSQGCCQLTGRQ